MFHAISAALARLVGRIADRRSLPFEYATWHGWETRRIRRGTYQFRDPRFGQLAAARTVQAQSGHTWAQAAMADRIRSLSPATVSPARGRAATADRVRILTDQYCPYDGGVLVKRTYPGGAVIWCFCGWETTTGRRRAD